MEPNNEISLQELGKQIENNPKKNLRKRYNRLLEAEKDEWNDLDTPRRLQLTGVLYNYSEDLGKKDGLIKLIDLNEDLETGELEGYYIAQRYYQLANAYSLLDALKVKDHDRSTFFDSEDLLNAIKYSRAAVTSSEIQSLPEERVAQSFVNFANLLSRAGRFCEAIRWYNRALEINPAFGMALGNRGQCKTRYASYLFTRGHEEKFLHSAHNDLEKAFQNTDSLSPHAPDPFKSLKEKTEPYSDEQFSIKREEEFKLGDSEEAKEYFKWVLKNHLFLNPLNDTSTHTCVAHDYLHLPNMVIPEDDQFPYPGIYNQIKQEYVSARYMYYEGTNNAEERGHFSDQNVQLPDTLDYSIYGYRTEQIKTALRLSYSIFDKIGNIINHYFNVDHDETGFRQVWYEDGEYEKGLASPFKNIDNWPFNALYWIRKDFHSSISERDEDSLVIVAHELGKIRREMEHDYLKIFDDDILQSPPDRKVAGLKDSPSYSIGKGELKEAGLQMLRLSRAALIYISLAIHREERKKHEDIEGPIVPIGGNVTIPDELKE